MEAGFPSKFEMLQHLAVQGAQQTYNWSYKCGNWMYFENMKFLEMFDMHLIFLS